MYDITDCRTHLLVEFRNSARFDSILSAITEVLNHPKYLKRNDIWVFGPHFLNLEIEQLGLITGFIEQSYPAAATRTKTAIVSESGFNNAIAQLWADTTGHLPYEAKVFASMDDAMAWIAA